MARPDPRVTAYIDRARPFAKPVLDHIRSLWQAHCPGGEETIKWSMPMLTYKGRSVSGMGAFKGHVTLGFWYGRLVTGGTGFEHEAMGSFGRITGCEDLPGDAILAGMIVKSVELIDAGIKPPRDWDKKTARPAPGTPAALSDALDGNPAARKSYDGFSPSQQREYDSWIAEAKRDETRAKRVAQAIEWLAQGKKRNWKYENC